MAQRYKGSSDAIRRAVAKYQTEKVEQITLRVAKGKKAYYKKIADAAGISLNQYIVNAMDEKIDRER